MKNTTILFFLFTLSNLLLSSAPAFPAQDHTAPRQTIFAFGDDISLKMVRQVAYLTGKDSPRICYVPTASGDNEGNIMFWENLCNMLGIETHILRVWVSSENDTVPFRETLLSMDAIVVGGGNTLNMMGIWKAQGIDLIMREALEQGIVLAGGSAGSICWFENGVSDARPGSLSIVDGLGFLPLSNCPHYGDPERKEFYHRAVASGEMKPGYAQDNLSAVLFIDGQYRGSFSFNENNHSYLITPTAGGFAAEELGAELLIDKNALPPDKYRSLTLGRSLKECLGEHKENPIIEGFANFISSFTDADKREDPFANTFISNVHIADGIAAVINDRRYGFLVVSYMRDNDGIWTCSGEDIAETVGEAEITFREKAEIILLQE